MIFERLAGREGFELEQGVLDRLARWLEAARDRAHRQGERFANARTVETLFNIVDTRLALRLLSLPEAERAANATLISPVDVPEAGQTS